MAYAATTAVRIEKSGHYVLTVAETGAGAATEWDTKGVGATVTSTGGDKLPTIGRIIAIKVLLGAGAGATVDPILGRAANPTTIFDKIWENGAAAASVNVQLGIEDDNAYRLIDGTLYGRSVCNAGADNVVTTEIWITAGW